jgi:hypothetical protein
MTTHDDALINRIKYSDPVNPFELLETPWGQMEAWRRLRWQRAKLVPVLML